MTEPKLQWKRDEKNVEWNGKSIPCMHGVLWACEMPNCNGFCIVLMFDEETPDFEPNVCIYSKGGKLKQNIVIREDGNLVRFLGCSVAGNNLFLTGANDTGYLIDPKTFAVIDKHYIR